MIPQFLYVRLNKLSSSRSIITLFLLSHLVLFSMMLFTFPQINAKIGAKAFDLRPLGYSYSEAVFIIQNLDLYTSDIYIFQQLLFLDVLYPLLLALFLSSFMVRLFRLNLQSQKLLSFLLLIPFMAMMFDYLENICIFIMISESTQISAGFVAVASSLTLLKGIFTTLSWFIVLTQLVIWTNKNFRSNRDRSVIPSMDDKEATN